MSNYASLDDLTGGNNNKPTTGRNEFDITGGGKPIQINPPVQQPNYRQAVPTMTAGPIDPSTVKPVDINALLPKRAPEPTPLEFDLMGQLDAAVNREKEKITEFHDELFDKIREEVEAEQSAEETAVLDAAIENGSTITSFSAPNDTDYDMTDDVDEETGYSVEYDHVCANVDDNVKDNLTDETASAKTEEDSEPEQSSTPINSILGYMKNEDLFDDEDEQEDAPVDQPTGPSEAEAIRIIKEEVSSRLGKKKVDLTKFKFAQKAMSAQKVMKLAVTGHQNIADWILPMANRTISMTGLSGPEILKLDPSNSNRNRLNTFKDMYGVLYKHVVDANKPDFETWLKQLRFGDMQHVYFAAYMATFNGSSFINYSCPHCQNLFIHDIEFSDAVVYKDDETKQKVKDLLKMDSTTQNADEYEVQLVQVSDNYAFGIRTPSVWNTVMEIATLSDKFLEQHADLIDMIAYIDTIYLIDYDNGELIPVDVKPDHNDMGKTVARRVKSLHDIISTLSSDEYMTIRSAINELDTSADDISYRLPGCTCPKCNKEIPANDNFTPEQMLFTRHQLAAIANMSN